jgi:hypothetical protein
MTLNCSVELGDFRLVDPLDYQQGVTPLILDPKGTLYVFDNPSQVGVKR